MRVPVWIPLLVAALLALLGSVYTVTEGHGAIVLNLGRVVRTDMGPGLHFKWPLIESALEFDRRLTVLDAEPERYLTSENKDVSVDFFAIGRIEDLRAFYRATGGNETFAIDRLAPIIKNALRNEINSRTLSQVVSGDRSDIVKRQLESINKGAATLGVRIIDLRLKQVDLPTEGEVIGQVYRRMRAQRQQVASQLRAEGDEAAQKIVADADRDRQVIEAEAERGEHLRPGGQQGPGLLRLPAQPGGLPRLVQGRQYGHRARQGRPVPAVHEERPLRSKAGQLPAFTPKRVPAGRRIPDNPQKPDGHAALRLFPCLAHASKYQEQNRGPVSRRSRGPVGR